MKSEEAGLDMLDLRCLCNIQVELDSVQLSELDQRMAFGKPSI